ncbi:hypothetical protein AAF712_011430 [Marasmius tenuissimus]|uniref:Uncharacterized protein n=1 Tax=Marasmius tenuissimus TaxID=585030 RepID=A0ABR2ZLX6_9AGAR
MSDDASNPTLKYGLKGDLDFAGLLDFPLGSHLKNEPFGPLSYKRYIPHRGFDHYPPKFEYGAALAKSELVASIHTKARSGNRPTRSPASNGSAVFRQVDSRLYDILNVKGEDGILLWSADERQKRNFPEALLEYNLEIWVIDPDTPIKQLEEKFGHRAKWLPSSSSDDVPGWRPHYKISGE